MGFAYEKKKKKNGARIKIKLAGLFITFNVGFAYEKKKKKTGMHTKKQEKKQIIRSVIVCEASPTEI